MQRRRWIKHRPLFTNLAARARKSKFDWKFMPILWIAFKRMCFALGLMVLFSTLMALYLTSTVASPALPPLPEKIVLYITFEDGFIEQAPDSGFQAFAEQQLTVQQIIDNIDHAAKDKRVVGLMARMKGGDFALSQVQEVRAAVKRFREAGKFAYIYSSSYGEAGGGLGRFYLASAFEERWMQPMGIVSIGGVSAEIPFFRETLDKIGVEPDFFKRKEYKTAYESMTNRKSSPQNREMMEDLIETVRTVIMNDIPQDLGMEVKQFEALVDTGLFPAKEAVDARLITKADYVDVLLDRIVGDITGDPESEEEVFVDLGSYDYVIAEEAGGIAAMGQHRPEIALVHASGMIMETDPGTGAPDFAGGGIAAADEIAPAILAAADDERIEAVVLRIDSPGGSPVASESILRAVEKAREKGKPVIVSMGSTAASGGYWIAAYADKIFALPSTLTGSIGVVGGKFSMGGLWEKLGVNWESAQWGENAGMWSVNSGFSASEAARVNAMMDQVYDGFVARVAKGRDMTPEAVDKVAGGRVWTGLMAKEAGLVDELGGLHEALNYTAQLLGAEDKTQLSIVILPRPKTTLEQIMELLGQHTGVYESLKLQGRVLEFMAPLTAQVSLMNSSEVLTYEPLKLN